MTVATPRIIVRYKCKLRDSLLVKSTSFTRYWGAVVFPDNYYSRFYPIKGIFHDIVVASSNLLGTIPNIGIAQLPTPQYHQILHTEHIYAH